MTAATFEEGRDYLDALYARNQDIRAANADDYALLRAAYQLEFDTEEQRQAFMERAAELNEPLVNEIAQFGRVAMRWEDTGEGDE
jgi:type VI protein secretion system component VasF